MSYKLPFGAAKGQEIESADTRHLEWVCGKVSESLAADPNKAYADKDRALVAAIKAEIERRKAGGAPAAPASGSAPREAEATAQRGSALARRKVDGIQSYRDGIGATKAMEEIAKVAHLVTSATAVGELPPGCTLALSSVFVDPARECYDLPGGKKGLGKVALDRISASMGISWDPVRSRRLDNGSDPHYCHYLAVGHYRSFDGSPLTVTGEVEIDARDGSPQFNEIREKAERANRADGGASQILELRKFILRHAQSKAKHRAVRSLGIQTSYTAAELEKPFVVARPMFTGHSEDPELRREFAKMSAAAMLGGIASLYPSIPALPTMQTGHAPPPIGSDTYDTDGESSPGYGYDDEPPFQGTGTDGLSPADDLKL